MLIINSPDQDTHTRTCLLQLAPQQITPLTLPATLFACVSAVVGTQSDEIKERIRNHPKLEEKKRADEMDEDDVAMFIIEKEASVDEADFLLRNMLEDKPCINIGQKNSKFIHTAAFCGSVKCLRALLENKAANVDMQNSVGETPLHHAADNNKAECVQLLLESNANVNLQTDYQKTPLHYAASVYHGNVKCAQLLLNRENVNVNLQDDEGETPLHCAVGVGNADCVSLLLNREDVKVNLQNDEGQTPLHIAASNGNVHCVRFLLNRTDAEVDLRDDEGQTPLHCATRLICLGHSECVSLLLNRGADVNLKNNKGRTPLHNAAHTGNVECVQLLLSKDANKHMIDKAGLTPLDYAIRNRNKDCIGLLN